METSYITAGVWGLWQNNVALNQILEVGKILCWAAKWEGESALTFRKHTDTDFLSQLHLLLDQADAVLTYNGKRFDIPTINREFVKAGYGPPSPYKHIDVLETVKKAFRFPSNKMAHVTAELNLGAKTDHEGFPLWVKCVEEDPVAWKKMTTYNKQDVKLLEKLYNKVKPWISNHPNHNLYGKTGVCTTCGSKHVQKRGTYKTQTGIYSRLHCQDCGAWSRTRFTEVAKEVREYIYTGVAL